MRALQDKIVLVTGASRGGGRGIAQELGAAGATVVVTGRTTGNERPGEERGESIDHTARLVDEAGGRGIPRVCDHSDDGAVEALFQWIATEWGRLDVLVNNVWGGYENYDQFDAPFWEQPPSRLDIMFNAGARAHFTASRLAAPLMIAQGAGLIINTTAAIHDRFLGSVPYDTTKAAINRMAYGMNVELRSHGVTALALAPGWMRSEAVLRYFATDEAHWTEVEALAATESTRYVGRAVAALAADPEVAGFGGELLTVGALARHYGFNDVDGRQPPPFDVPDDQLKD